MIRKVCFFGRKKVRFMQTESVLKTKNRSGPAKNRFSVALSSSMRKAISRSIYQVRFKLAYLAKSLVISDKWAGAWQNQQKDSAPSEDSDQPGHLLGLIKVFALHSKVVKDPRLLHTDSEDWWSNCVDAKADLSLPWAHWSFCWFCRASAQIVLRYKAKSPICSTL